MNYNDNDDELERMRARSTRGPRRSTGRPNPSAGRSNPCLLYTSYLSESCPELSRSYIQKLLKSGQVLVNKKGVKASYVVSEDDHIELEVPAAVEPEIEAEAMDLDILYEDQDIILINKPKGMVVHPAAGHYSHTLVNGLMYPVSYTHLDVYKRQGDMEWREVAR